jgi:RNA polymerase-associated protein RTF1
MSENELDAELLKLAGDDSSDNEDAKADEEVVSRPHSPANKAAENATQDVLPTTTPKRGVAQKKPERTSRMANKAKKDESEEGEA